MTIIAYYPDNSHKNYETLVELYNDSNYKKIFKLQLSCNLNKIPNKIYELDLKELNCSYNNINSIPDEINKFKNLEILNI